MTSNAPSSTSDDLDQIIADFLAAEEAGKPLDRTALIAEHAELANELREFLADQDRIHRLAGALAADSSPRRFVPPKVRYFGDYELLEEIARGGMGVIYKAKQTSLNRIVAVKMILAGHLASPEDVKRFHTEAEAAATLTHPGIVPVHEVGVHEGQHYFSMDYIEGRSLAEVVRENPLPAQRAAEYVRAIAEAVHYAHQQGTLHRDLKPSNILIDGKDHVHVTDFGLAIPVEGHSELTRTGQVLGTPAYMPPEQAQGGRGRIGPAADVYSLGAILYELLTGRPPFKAESSVETLQQVIEAEPVSPRLLNPKVPRDLETICLMCLRKEPGKRFTTAALLEEDLGRWLNQEPIRARRVSRAEKAWLWCRRRPAIAGMIAAILVTCLMLAFTVAERQRNVRRRVETAVAAVGTTHGDLVPYAIEELEAFPSRIVLSELRDQYQAVDESQRLSLACALAHFGDVRVEDFVLRIGDAAPEDVDNLAAALGHSRSQAVTVLEAAAEAAERREEWRHKARLAMMALHLEAPALARDMCRWRPDPIQRTWFIEECSTWHGDLSRLARLVGESEDVPLRAVVALAAGSAADVADSDRRAWVPLLSNWYQNAPDTLTHSAAGWTLRKWGLELPEIAQSGQPIEKRNWHVNTAGMTMLLIPAGSFARRDDRYPETAVNQTVTLSRPFLLADRQVTRAQFQEFMDDPDYPDAEKPRAWNGAYVRYSPTEQHPVQQVNWYDAVLFCNWLSHREGLTPCHLRTGERERIDGREVEVWRCDMAANGYRLPTEAEWEYACRAGTQTEYSHGDDESLLDRYAVYYVRETELPGSKLPNGWGFFDMHGNVYEWCQDRFGPYGGETTVSDPTGPVRGSRRVARGGSFLFDANLLRSAYRSIGHPNNRPNRSGFRVARTLDLESLAAADQTRRLAELFAPALDRADLATYMELIERIEQSGVTLADLVEVRPDDPALPAIVAKRQATAGDTTQAAKSLTKARKLLQAQFAGSQLDSTLVRLLVELLQSQAEDPGTVLEQCDLLATIAAFQRSLERDPTSAPAYLLLGDQLAERDALAAAIAAYRQAAVFDSTDPGVYQRLGTALRRSNQLGAAIDAFRQAYDLEPDNREFQTAFIVSCFDAGRPQTAIDAVRGRLNAKPARWQDYYLLARLLRYTGDVSGYRDVCRRMFDEFSASDDFSGRHGMLSAWLFFPEAEPVRDELLEIVKEQAANGYAIHRRMLGLAYYRLGDDEQALPILELVAAGRLPSSNSKVTCLLCLALVQLRMERPEAARTSIAQARALQLKSPQQTDPHDWQPWGPIPSLWREVQAALDAAGLDESVPELTPTYAAWPTTSQRDVPSASVGTVE